MASEDELKQIAKLEEKEKRKMELKLKEEKEGGQKILEIKEPQKDLTKLRTQAFERLKFLMGAASADPYQKFLMLKRGIEIYVNTLNCKIGEETFQSHFENLNSKKEVMDIIIESIDPEEHSKPLKSFYKFSSTLDSMISDDLMAVWRKDLKFLAFVKSPHRTNKILRRIGSEFYSNKTLRQTNATLNLLKLGCRESDTITYFIKVFASAVKSCEEQDCFTNLVDQKVLFRIGASKGRRTNQAVANGLVATENLPSESSLMEYMTLFSQNVLRQHEKGFVPFDEEQMLVNFTKSKKQNQEKKLKTFEKKEKSKEKNICFNCGEDYPHADECEAKGKECEKCNGEGHLEKMCQFQCLKCFEKGHSASHCPKRKGKKKKGNSTFTYQNEETQETNHGDGFKLFSLHNLNLKDEKQVEKNQIGRAVVDTGANCFIFNNLDFFQTFEEEKSSVIQQTSANITVDGKGIAKFSFAEFPDKIFTVPAYFCKEAHYSILENLGLFKLGCRPVHEPEDACVWVTPTERIGMCLETGLSLVSIVPFRKEVNLTREELWHRRMMHLSLETLKKTSQLKNLKKMKMNCDTCVKAKAAHRKSTVLEPEKKFEPKYKGEAISIDILVPPADSKSCVSGVVATLVVVELFTRISLAIHIKSYSSKNVLISCLRALNVMRVNPKLIVADRQAAMTAKTFVDYFALQKTHIKFIPRDRHSEFNPVVERQIANIKAMTRAALLDSNLGNEFWPFAVQYSCFVKNRAAHSNLKNKSPYEVFFGRKPNLKVIKTFGCLTHVLKPQSKPRDKFGTLTTETIFLSISEMTSAAFTVTVYDPVTKRLKHPHFTDVWFNEEVTWTEHLKNKLETFRIDADSVINKHLPVEFDESDDEKGSVEIETKEKIV